MSRVGKKEIKIKEGVSIDLGKNKVVVKGPKGELSFSYNKNIDVKLEEGVVRVVAKKNDKKTNELFGLTRTIINNMIIGVSEGFEKVLEIHGVGFKASMEGKDLVLSLGFSHPVRYTPREGIEISVDKNEIVVRGIDKQLVGQTAAEIRDLKKPEPYKGKGIKYKGEHIRRKAGKTAVKA